MGEIDEAIHEAMESGAASGLHSLIAMLVAITATVMALANIKGQNIVQRMDAAQIERVDQWTLYQAKSTKQNLAEGIQHQLQLALVTNPALSSEQRQELEQQRAHYAAEVERYQQEKVEIKAKAEAAEDKAEDKVSALVQEWLDADEELAEATSPLDRRVAQKRRDQAARALADAVDDDVISDQLIIDTWPQITAYGRALGWSLKEVLRFLAGPEKSISVPDADDADDAGDDDDDDDGGDGGDDKGDAADDKDGDKDKGEVPAPAKDYAGLRRGEGQG